MKLALGPNLFYWPRQRTLDFYAGMATQPVDIVYLGETVCSRRHEMRAEDWLDLANLLADAGKEVVLSSQALIESESDLKALRRLVESSQPNGRFVVEANEMGAVRLLAEKRLPFVAGPSLNIFNAHTLKLLAEMGATRWVMPPESSRATLTGLLADAPTPIETEVFAFGRLPLAWSARCFTARRFNLQKDTCEFKCVEFPNGLMLKTREDQEFLVINGIQTLSAKTYNLLAELPQLAASGVNVVRLSPQIEGMATVIARFREVQDRRRNGDEAAHELATMLPAGVCNGFWHGQPGLDQVAGETVPARLDSPSATGMHVPPGNITTEI